MMGKPFPPIFHRSFTPSPLHVNPKVDEFAVQIIQFSMHKSSIYVRAKIDVLHKIVTKYQKCNSRRFQFTLFPTHSANSQ